MIVIDGSYGEGGGQILRSSLALSMVTGKAFRIEKIRSSRRKSGLLRQHLTAVNAAAEISGANVEGAKMGSTDLTFAPGKVKGGEYRFAVGTAGSGTLVLQAVLPALINASEASVLTVEGGTHNPYAPPYDFLRLAFLPLLGKMGCEVETKIERYGFYPAGGGKFKVFINPTASLKALELIEKGQSSKKEVRGIVSEIPFDIPESEVEIALQELGWENSCGIVENVDSPGPGNALMIEVASENVTELFTGFGELRVPLRKVVKNAVEQTLRYLAADVPVGRFLADQLLIPLVMAGAGKFRTLSPSMHTRTNIEIIKKFVDVEVTCNEIKRDDWEIEIKI